MRVMEGMGMLNTERENALRRPLEWGGPDGIAEAVDVHLSLPVRGDTRRQSLTCAQDRSRRFHPGSSGPEVTTG